MKQFSEMTTSEQVDYWIGYLLVEIGRARFRDAVGTMLIATLTEAGREAEKKAKRSK